MTSQDLVDGLLRSSMAAKNAGLSFDQAVAYLTVLREASGRTGREVGNAFNSILSMIRRASSINTFEALGIEVYADKAAGKLKSIDTLFQAIAERWNTAGLAFQDAFVKATQDTELFSEELAIATGLQEEYNAALEEYNDIQKRDIAQSSAGIYRRNYFIALIENLAKVQGVLNNMTDAAGYSMRENERTMEALEMKVNALKTAFTLLAVEIGEAGLLDVMKGTVDGTREMVEAFSELPPEIKQVIIMLGEMVVVMGVANLTAKTFFSVDLIKKITAYTTATGAATLANRGLAASFMTIPLWGQIALLTTLGMTIYSFAVNAETATEKAKRLMEQNTEAANRAKAQADEIERLAKQYETLAKKEEGSAEKSEGLIRATKELTDLVPTAITGFDAMGNAITDIGTASEESARKVAELRAEVLRNAEANALIAQETLPELQKAEKEAKARKDLIESMYKSKNYRGILGGGETTGATEFDRVKWFFMFGDNPKWLERSTELYEEAIAEYEEAHKALKAAEAAIKTQDLIEEGKDIFSPTSSVIKPGRETPAQAYERLNAERQLLNHQMKIGEVSAAQYLASLRNIEQQMRAAGVEEKKIWSLQEEIYSLAGKDSKGKTLAEYIQERQSYYQHLLRMEQISTQEYIAALEELEAELAAVGGAEKELWAIQEEIFTLRVQEAKRAQDEMYSDAMAYYQHETALARMSFEQQVNYLRELTKAHQWEKQKMWSLEEQLFRLYKQELSEQQREIERAYQEQMDWIDTVRDAQIASIQAQIDALQGLNESDRRTEAERQHLDKVAELEKEKRYHELRTGREHEEALVDIEKQIEEENARWKQQLAEWERENLIRTLQQEIEYIRDRAEQEKAIWRQKYDDIKAYWDTWSTEFAQSAINDPKWLETGKSIGRQIASGFSQGIAGMDAILGSIGTSGGGSGWSGGGGSGGWSGGYTQETYGGVTYDIPVLTPEQAQAMFDELTQGSVPAFDQGGLAVGRGLMFKDTIEPERVLSPQLTVSFDRLVAALETNRLPQGRRDVTFNAPLFHADSVELEDRQDMELLAREIYRQVRKVM